MKFIAIYVATLLLFLFSFQKVNAMGSDNLEYFGADHQQAEFSFNATLIVKQKKSPTHYRIDYLIRKQMRYMLGLMRSRVANPAALYPKWNYKVLSITQPSPGQYLVIYNLKSKGIFRMITSDYTFTLPYDPQTIYDASQGKCREEESDEPNFWYHWNPTLWSCPLKVNVDYYDVTVPLKPIPNTVTTYPEYDKLVDSNKTIKMTMFFGFSNYGYSDWTPQGTNDFGIQGYNQQRDFLKSLGFEETIWSRQQVEALYKAKDGYEPYIIEYNLSGKKANIRIRIVLCDTGLYHRSTAFHNILKEALANESVVVYDGHSGLGHNLDLASIEKMRGFKFKFNPNYQILFLGSCVPYAYYTQMFFDRKKNRLDPNGTLNLDILSYGQEAVFGNKEDRTLTRALVKYAQFSDKTTYQQMIKSSPNYYFGVNGDEDNPGISNF